MTWPRAAVLILLAAFPAIAGAALPLETEDTGTTDRVEVEVAAAYQSTTAGDSGDQAVAVNVGVLASLEASVAGTLAVDDPAGGKAEAGLGDALLGVKYRFLDEASPWPALLARLTLQLPTGDEARGLGEGHAASACSWRRAARWGPSS